ncbi:hypothetical protein Ami103574_08030 [Aminipila butyrica]|uniref:Uncharacterized protein n=1 Tax=Aminipila butyrica TaxID=433296 RepID=A0A858BTL6_9FIRM|nr:DUF5702 domain-containing protein [Aminipila butyrica]QIB69273.1 hypothetical protein Ami103574_08030 [Aminipila butyrica]
MKKLYYLWAGGNRRPKLFRRNKRGSMSVLLSMIFVCLIMAATVLVIAAAGASSYSYYDCVLQGAGRSVLSEYHLALKENYGLMAFSGYNQEVDDKLAFYANGSFQKKESQYRVNYIKPKLTQVSSNLSSFSLLDIDNFEKDLVDYMKHPQVNPPKKAEKIYEGKAQLINEKVLNSLPSRGVEGRNLELAARITEGLPPLEDLFSKATNRLLVDQYALEHFNYNLGWGSRTETFFKNELEYILYGKKTDGENRLQFINDFKVLRMILNSAHIYGDLKKRNQVLEMAALLTPGPEAALTAIALTEAWAYGESVNDVELLVAGEKVALYKNSRDWALDLETAINGTKTASYVKPAGDNGITYKDYLRIFLYLEDRQAKLLRMMDLIQINMQGGFDQNFYIKDCYVGLQIEAKVSGQEFSYVQQY